MLKKKNPDFKLFASFYATGYMKHEPVNLAVCLKPKIFRQVSNSKNTSSLLQVEQCALILQCCCQKAKETSCFLD